MTPTGLLIAGAFLVAAGTYFRWVGNRTVKILKAPEYRDRNPHLSEFDVLGNAARARGGSVAGAAMIVLGSVSLVGSAVWALIV